MDIITPAPTRCLECEHPVGPDGDHYVRRADGLVWCRPCRTSHVVSRAMRWGMWRPDFERWLGTRLEVLERLTGYL